MSMNRKSLKNLLVAGLAGVLALPALAQPMPGRGDGHRPPEFAPHGRPGGAFCDAEGRQPPFLHGLKLTEEQHDRIFDVLHGQAPDLRQQAKALHKARQELRDLALSGQYEEGRAKVLADAVAKAVGDMALLRARSDQAIYALLTPEQRQELEGARAGSGGERRRPGR